MENIPHDKLEDLRGIYGDTIDPRAGDPLVDQQIMDLRTSFAQYGIDLTDSKDFYFAWATVTNLLNCQDELVGLGMDRERAMESLYSALVASTPPALQ